MILLADVDLTVIEIGWSSSPSLMLLSLILLHLKITTRFLNTWI